MAWRPLDAFLLWIILKRIMETWERKSISVFLMPHPDTRREHARTGENILNTCILFSALFSGQGIKKSKELNNKHYVCLQE